MANNVPLYTGSREYARAHDELPLWRESLNENIRCKQAIEDAIRKGFDGMHLNPDCAESVIQEFGFDRVEYVLGNTLQQLKYDGRFSWSNKEWGENIEMSFFASDTKGDLARNYATIAKRYYGYDVSVIDLRNPTRSDGSNLLTLINRYMDIALADESNIAAKAKAEKYAKIIKETTRLLLKDDPGYLNRVIANSLK